VDCTATSVHPSRACLETCVACRHHVRWKLSHPSELRKRVDNCSRKKPKHNNTTTHFRLFYTLMLFNMGLNLILAVATFAAVVNTATAANGTIDFALMGVQKAGTTFLSKQVLAKHPMVYLNTKEIHFWDHCQPLPDACSHNWTQLLDDGIAAHKKSFLTAPVPQNCSLDKWVASLHSHPKDRLWGDKTPIYVSMPYVRCRTSVLEAPATRGSRTTHH